MNKQNQQNMDQWFQDLWGNKTAPSKNGEHQPLDMTPSHTMEMPVIRELPPLPNQQVGQ